MLMHDESANTKDNVIDINNTDKDRKLSEIEEKLINYKPPQNHKIVNDTPDNTANNSNIENNNTKIDDKLKDEIERHKLELQKMKLYGEMEREKLKITSDNELENIKSQINRNMAKRDLNNSIPKVVSSKIWGLIFILTAVIATFASTVITLCSGWNVYETDDMTKIAFLSSIVVIQGSIFVFNCMRTKILTQYPGYTLIFHVITKSLLLVSIYFNFMFFNVQYNAGLFQQFIILLSCIMLDCIAVYSTSLGMDLFTLNMYARAQAKSLMDMYLFNITSKFRNKNLQKYNENVDDYNEIAKLKGKKNKDFLIEKSHDKSHEISNDNLQLENNKNDDFSHEKSHEKLIESSLEKNGLQSGEKNSADIGNSFLEGHADGEKSHENSDMKSNKKKVLKTAKEKQNSHEKSHVKTGKSKPKNPLERVSNFISENYKTGDKVDVKLLKKRLKINDYQWNINRKKLMDENILKVENGATFLI